MAIKVIFFDIGNTLVKDRQWMPGAKAILSKARQSKTRVGIMSNTGDLTRDQLAKLLPGDFDLDDFDQDILLLSSEVGIEKPELGIFLLAIQHANVSPWETMFVGESLVEVYAAQKAGMRAVRLCDSEKDYPELTKILGL